MSTISLHDFVAKTIGKGRISFGDLRRLQRDILPDGIASREEAKLLIGLDRSVLRADPAWAAWLAAAVVDFVVWGERPTGYVEADAARWLAALLASEGTPTKAARLIAREVVREAQEVDEALVSFAGSDAKPAPEPMPVETNAALLAA